MLMKKAKKCDYWVLLFITLDKKKESEKQVRL